MLPSSVQWPMVAIGSLKGLSGRRNDLAVRSFHRLRKRPFHYSIDRGPFALTELYRMFLNASSRERR